MPAVGTVAKKSHERLMDSMIARRGKEVASGEGERN